MSDVNITRTFLHQRQTSHIFHNHNHKQNNRRISLHQYDPKDLSSDIQMKPSVPKDTKPANTLAGGKQQNDIHTTIQETQIAQASSEGLQVDFSAISIEPCDIDDAKFVDCTNQSSKEMDEWENGDNELVDFDDSDDDLL